MRKLKAVFWDVDGTLADTEIYGHRIAFNRIFKQINLDWYWDKSTYINLLKIQGGVNRIKHYKALKSRSFMKLADGGGAKAPLCHTKITPGLLNSQKPLRGWDVKGPRVY